MLPIAPTRSTSCDFWKKVSDNPGDISFADVLDMLGYFCELRKQQGLEPSTISEDDARYVMLAGLDGTLLPSVEPSAVSMQQELMRQIIAGLDDSVPPVEPSTEKSAKRRQRQTKIADKRRAAAAHTA